MTRFVRALVILLLGFNCAVMFCSCESGGGDDGGDEAEITGNAYLLAVNQSEDETTVYFDGMYIGNVGGGGHREWNVPSGSHTIKIDNAEYDNSEEAESVFNFVDGQTTAIYIDWEHD